MRGRTMAIFHMTQVILVIGAMFIGALAEWIGARWAAHRRQFNCYCLMIAIFLIHAQGAADSLTHAKSVLLSDQRSLRDGLCARCA